MSRSRTFLSIVKQIQRYRTISSDFKNSWKFYKLSCRIAFYTIKFGKKKWIFLTPFPLLAKNRKNVNKKKERNSLKSLTSPFTFQKTIKILKVVVSEYHIENLIYFFFLQKIRHFIYFILFYLYWFLKYELTYRIPCICAMLIKIEDIFFSF